MLCAFCSAVNTGDASWEFSGSDRPFLGLASADLGYGKGSSPSNTTSLVYRKCAPAPLAILRMTFSTCAILHTSISTLL